MINPVRVIARPVTNLYPRPRADEVAWRLDDHEQRLAWLETVVDVDDRIRRLARLVARAEAVVAALPQGDGPVPPTAPA
jgi:hypothetical protein